MFCFLATFFYLRQFFWIYSRWALYWTKQDHLLAPGGLELCLDWFRLPLFRPLLWLFLLSGMWKLTEDSSMVMMQSIIYLLSHWRFPDSWLSSSRYSTSDPQWITPHSQSSWSHKSGFFQRLFTVGSHGGLLNLCEGLSGPGEASN